MQRFTRAAHYATGFAGSWMALAVLGVLVLGWLGAGVATGWSREWELVVTTGAPILTLVVVVILQHSQNRNARAMHLKLNELLTTLREPDSEVINAEERSDDELRQLDAKQRRHLA
jgi:low affinity Fe/Cu permease